MARRYSRIISSIIAVLGIALAPQLAQAAAVTGQIVWVRTCPDGSGGTKVVIRHDAGGTLRTIYLGSETGGSSTISSVVMAAFLSGKTVTVDPSGSAATQCGITALYANGATNYVQIN